MADNVLFKSGLASSVITTAIEAGQLLFAIDGETGSIYYDKDSETRIKLNADAHKLVTARKISLAGSVTGSVDFDGSAGVTIQTTVTDNSHKHTIANITGLQAALDNIVPKFNDTGSETVPVYFLDGIPVACTSISLNANTASKWKDARIISISSTAGKTGTSIDGSTNQSLILPQTLTNFTSISSTTFIGNLIGTADSAKEADHATSADSADTANTAGHATTAGTANLLKGANINGSLFTGEENIVTELWGKAHTFKIANSDGSNATEGISVDGSGNTTYTLKLPATIRGAFIGDVAGHATSATTAKTADSAGTAGEAETAKKLAAPININFGGDITGDTVSFDGSSNITLVMDVNDNSHKHTIANVTGLQDALDNKVELDGTGATGTSWGIGITGNAGSASKLLNAQTFKIDSVAKANATSSFDGTAGVTLILPTTITGLSSISTGSLTASGTITAKTFEGAFSGTATSANKLTVNAGSKTTPIYFTNGVPTVCETTKDAPLDVITKSANKLTTPVNISFGGDLSGNAVSFDGSGNITLTANVRDDSHNHVIGNVDGLSDALAGKADKTQAIYYIEGTGTTGSTWTGTHSEITEYYNGLVIAYKIGVTGSSSGSTLNINDLGAVAVMRNESGQVTTHYPVGSIVLLVYTEDADGEASWEVADYDTNNAVTQYYTTTDASYPLLFRYDSGITATSNKTTYSRFGNKLYVNPSTGTIYATTFSGALSGNATSATTATTATKLNSSAGSATEPIYFSGGKPVKCVTSKDAPLNVVAKTANALTTAINLGLTGDVTGSVTGFNGSTNTTITTSLNVNYAGSSSKGGVATSAYKLVDDGGKAYNAGDANTPVYFLDGVPTTITGDAVLDVKTENAKTADKWTTSKQFSISAAAQDDTTAVDGSANATLYIPKTINGFTKITATTFEGSLNGPATKLGTTTVGGVRRPIYLNAGVATQVAIPSSGAWFTGVLSVGSTGITQLGRYLDFHNSNTSTNDYDVRIDAASANENILYLPGETGQFVIHTNDTAVGGTTRPVYIAASGVATGITCTAIAYGGTGTSTAPTKGGIIYASSTSAYASTGAGTSGQILQSNGGSAPSWITPTSSSTANTIVKRDSSGNFSAGTITATLKGNASTATALAKKVKIGVSGDATGQSPEWDGSETTLTIPIAIADDSHNHVISNVDGLQDALDKKVPLDGTGATGTWSISITGNAETADKLFKEVTLGVNLASNNFPTFDGSANVNAIGVSGTLGVGNGGTGKTTGVDAANFFLNSLATGESTPVDADYYISQYVKGGTTTTTYHRRPMSALWAYVQGKISSVLGLTSSTYKGVAAKATILETARNITTDLASNSAAPFNGSSNITPGVTGTLKVGNGGTGTATAPTQGGVIYASSTSTYASTAAGSSGQLLQSNGTGKPTWITATNSNTASTIVKRDGSGNFSAGTITANLSGNATTASYWQSSRTFSISSTAGTTGTSVNGSTNVTLTIPTSVTNFTKLESDTFVVNNKVTLQYNTTNECLEFVFA